MNQILLIFILEFIYKSDGIPECMRLEKFNLQNQLEKAIYLQN